MPIVSYQIRYNILLQQRYLSMPTMERIFVPGTVSSSTVAGASTTSCSYDDDDDDSDDEIGRMIYNSSETAKAREAELANKEVHQKQRPPTEAVEEDMPSKSSRVSQYKRYYKICSTEGCTSLSRKGGVCRRHHGAAKSASVKTYSHTTNEYVGDTVSIEQQKWHEVVQAIVYSHDGCTNQVSEEYVPGIATVKKTPYKEICTSDGFPNQVREGGGTEKKDTKNEPVGEVACNKLYDDETSRIARIKAINAQLAHISGKGTVDEEMAKACTNTVGTKRKIDLVHDEQKQEEEKKKKLASFQPDKLLPNIEQLYDCKICSTFGCTEYAQKGGECKSHAINAQLVHISGNNTDKICTVLNDEEMVCTPAGGTKQKTDSVLDEQKQKEKKNTREICSTDGCIQYAQKGGVCIKHGAKVKICMHEGCTNKVQKGGVCWRHGERKVCSHDECIQYAQKGGLCNRHGSKAKLCSHEGCTKYAQKGGECIKHGYGEKPPRKICSHDGCTKQAQEGGLCSRHGERKICSHDECSNRAQRGGSCRKHGAKPNTCSHEGCTNQGQKGGVCWSHGGKNHAKECSHEGCNNFAVQGGVCRRHGAKVKLCSNNYIRKLCSTEGCSNQSIQGGVCRKHGAKPKMCRHEGCTNNVQKGGICIRHGAKKKRCSHEGCTNQSKIGGVCCSHGAKRKKYTYTCSDEGCTNRVVQGGVCIRHGAKRT